MVEPAFCWSISLAASEKARRDVQTFNASLTQFPQKGSTGVAMRRGPTHADFSRAQTDAARTAIPPYDHEAHSMTKISRLNLVSILLGEDSTQRLATPLRAG